MAAEDVEEEMEYGPSDLMLAVMYEDDIGSNVYVSMDTDPANAPLLPMPTAVPPPPWGVWNGSTARSSRPRMSGSTASRAVGSKRRRCFWVPWSATSSNLQGGLPGRRAWKTWRTQRFLDHHPDDVRATEP